MVKEYDIVGIGEYLVDFSPSGYGNMGNPLYQMNPGGAPTNCLASCTALGGKTAIISAVGNDLFGRFLRDQATLAGINTRGLQTVDKSTTLVFVGLDGTGEREFAFVRSPGADTQISEEQLDFNLISQAKYLHFGSLSLTNEPSRSATMHAVRYAREHGAVISYDPNYRPGLWKNDKTAREALLSGARQADLVKMSEEELLFLTGCGRNSLEDGAKQIHDLGVRELYVTLGSAGAYYSSNGENGTIPGFQVNAIDTTGCGDAFTGAILYQHCYMENNMSSMTYFANAVGALCATKPGGMCAMPDMEHVKKLLYQ